MINDSIYRVSSVVTSPINFISFLQKKGKNHVFIYEENNILREELKKIREKNLKQEFVITKNKYLKDNNLTNQYKEGSVPARVLLDKQSPYLKSIIINQGTKSGIALGMPVLNENFLIGVTVEVNYLSSRVLLLNDLNSRIPVVINKTKIQAILTGKSTSTPVLDYLPEDYFPISDQIIFTSGKDGIFREGMPIGKTMAVKSDGLSKIKLFSDPNQLSYVRVLISDSQKKEID